MIGIATSSGLSQVNFKFDATQRAREDVEYLSLGTECQNSYQSTYLRAIDIQSGADCQTHLLNYDYFRDANSTFSSKAYGKRLRLENVQIYSSCVQAQHSTTDASYIGSYKFAYEGDALTNGEVTTRATLPHRLSKAVDHWGYWNGASGNDNNTQNEVNIPSTTIGSFTDGVANRESEVQPGAMKRGTLNRITYPTGGFTQFDYEANQAKTANIIK